MTPYTRCRALLRDLQGRQRLRLPVRPYDPEPRALDLPSALALALCILLPLGGLLGWGIATVYSRTPVVDDGGGRVP